jgi:hypothetical protein
MSKKKLDTVGILNELTGKSRFFESPIQPNAVKIPEKKIEPSPPDDNHATTISSNHDTVVPRYHDTAMIEVVRRALKVFGKEAATHRFTLEEKQSIAELIFAFRQKNIRTSENEITRIAINWLMLDYKNNGENSILHQALFALNS